MSNSSYLIPLAVGAAFGLALEHGRIIEPTLIQGQFALFHHNAMIKMFLTASAVSMLGFATLEAVFKKETSRSTFTVDFQRGLYAVIVGPALLGMGMAISGSCPGTVFAQLGAGSFGALFVLAGGLCGAYGFSVFFRYLEAKRETELLSEPKLSTETVSFNDFINKKFKTTLTVHQLSYYMGGAMLALVLLLEILVPWRSDLAQVMPNATLLTANPPILSGILIGCAQITLQYFQKRVLGSSSSYSCIVGNCLQGSVECPYLDRMACNFTWQVCLMGGITLGAFLSSTYSGAVYVGLPLTLWTAIKFFFSGAVMVFGGQLAGT